MKAKTLHIKNPSPKLLEFTKKLVDEQMEKLNKLNRNMVNRKQNKIESFLETVNREWQLSTTEEYVLHSILNIFLAENNTEIKKVEHLLNDETEELLELLNDREVLDYAINLGGFIASDDESGLEDALGDLNFNWAGKVSDEDMIKSLESDGWSVEFDKNYPKHQNDILTQSDLETLTNLFLEADFNKRRFILSCAESSNLNEKLISFATKNSLL